ncbi:MAG: DUF6804 family protein [Chitinophagaceae bacterium]
MLLSIIKIMLSILLLLCLLQMPYGYYQLVRFLGLLGFSVLAYFSFQQEQKVAAIIYIGLALLFQPFIKVALGRTMWNIVDIIVVHTDPWYPPVPIYGIPLYRS